MSENGAMSTYVVQHKLAGEGVSWIDVATVRVPARTKRPTIIAKAFDQAQVQLPEGGDWKIRVLDEESAREITVALEEQPPRLKIG